MYGFFLLVLLYHQNKRRNAFKNSFRIHQGDIEGEYQKQIKKVQDANANTLKQEDLKAQMEDFLMVGDLLLGPVCVNFNREYML